ncbi:MAG: tRNA guanosine(34) transglycosylase Tgt [Bacteroidales bacterium]|jgi:queuine tRNA-ribosyltransferase|nr:tRNA guanosine(34) transglycosylase Tgt [Bacteroidales bacterium]
MKFIISTIDKKSNARCGEIHINENVISTPIFMPVGTVGSVKGVHFNALRNDIKAEIILGNTYHLYLRPGIDVIREAGGLHQFNGWTKPILTDSGGFQVFSLNHRRKITENGVKFSSHIDGSIHEFTPENVIDIQRTIGSDIMMAFDECTPYPTTEEYAQTSMQRTHRWLTRCYNQWQETNSSVYGKYQSLFPIVQGSVYPYLRRQSAEFVASFDLDGNAIGGVSVGEPVELMYEITELCCNILPKDKPRYLMGVGTPANILECIAMGVDMFDCVMPTRNGRNAVLFTRNGIMNMRNEKWKYDFSPIEEESDLFVDKEHSKAYLRHLFINGEMLGSMIGSLHNLHFYLWLVKEAQKHIAVGDFCSWKNEMVKKVSTRL